MISNKGVSTDPAKISTVSHWPTPTNVTELRSFLGLASYYRRFIYHFAEVAAPLYRLQEKGSTFRWTANCTDAFEMLKKKLTSAPILAFPRPSDTFILDTDASECGIGAVLSQRQEGIERVIAYGSRTLTKSERNYSTTRKELLALVYFLQHFRCYLLGQPFIVRTDHAALTWLQQFKHPEGQLARWLEQLQEFEFQTEHRPGKQATLMLSRGYISHKHLLFTVLKFTRWNILGLCHGPLKSCNRLRQQILHLVLFWLG